MSPTDEFELLCSDVHPEQVAGWSIRGPDTDQVMADVQLHGESTHGYTPAFYEAAHFSISVQLAEQAP